MYGFWIKNLIDWLNSPGSFFAKNTPPMTKSVYGKLTNTCIFEKSYLKKSGNCTATNKQKNRKEPHTKAVNKIPPNAKFKIKETMNVKTVASVAMTTPEINAKR